MSEMKISNLNDESENLVLSSTTRWTIRILQILFIAGILATAWFVRGDMDMFDSEQLSEDRE